MRFPLNTWYAVVGSNTTFSNHDATTLRPGFLAGIGRNYYLSDGIYLQGEGILNQRRFLLPEQRIRYYTSGRTEVRLTEINFSVIYVDVALLAKIRAVSNKDTRLSFAIGPALSIPILDKTSYNVVAKENVESGARVPYDFSYNGYEPDAASPVVGVVAAVELEASKLLLKVSLNRALHTSNQIFPLQNEIRLQTFMLSLGYRLTKR